MNQSSHKNYFLQAEPGYMPGREVGLEINRREIRVDEDSEGFGGG